MPTGQGSPRVAGMRMELTTGVAVQRWGIGVSAGLSGMYVCGLAVAVGAPGFLATVAQVAGTVVFVLGSALLIPSARRPDEIESIRMDDPDWPQRIEQIKREKAEDAHSINEWRRIGLALCWLPIMLPVMGAAMVAVVRDVLPAGSVLGWATVVWAGVYVMMLFPSLAFAVARGRPPEQVTRRGKLVPVSE